MKDRPWHIQQIRAARNALLSLANEEERLPAPDRVLVRLSDDAIATLDAILDRMEGHA
jgi:hypothetical protein